MSWHDRIAKARERGEFSEDDKNDAATWVDCACGEQSEDIPRSRTGEPKDVALSYLGSVFSLAVDHDDFEEAASVFADIDNRSAKILAEIRLSIYE